ncbi:MAG: NADH-quinone oxidoreductase subunit N [Chloroflexota bacterium]
MVKDLLAVVPLLFLVVWACFLLLMDFAIPAKRKGVGALLAAVGLVIALGLTLGLPNPDKVAFSGMLVVDGFARFLNGLFIFSGLAGVALAYDYLKRMGLERGEYYALLLFSISGMMLMAMAADLIVVFLALELLSIPLYILAGFARPQPESEEAALKYFLLGAFAAGFVVYGVALVFGATGTTSLEGVVAAISAETTNLTLLVAGAGLILVGLGFKVAAVPFHMWTPDVYQGAPSAVTGFMAVGAKAGGFAALLRVFVVAFPAQANELTPVLWGVAALSMVVGNIIAIAQQNIKRMLAYSSIAHAGYILMAFVPFGIQEVTASSVAAGLFYLLAFAVTSFGAWAVVIALERKGNLGLSLDDYAGLGRSHPSLAAAMAVFMLSFTGVPPTLGFVGKFYLFRIVIDGGFVYLALVGVLTSLISAYYYLRVVVIMYMREGEPEVRSEAWLKLTTVAAAVGTVVLSLVSAPLFGWAADAVLRLF